MGSTADAIDRHPSPRTAFVWHWMIGTTGMGYWIVCKYSGSHALPLIILNHVLETCFHEANNKINSDQWKIQIRLSYLILSDYRRSRLPGPEDRYPTTPF